MLNVTLLQLLLIFIHLNGNLIITLFAVHVNAFVKEFIFKTHGELCFISSTSFQSPSNSTAEYQKKVSKAPSQAVSQVASSEYVHQEDILLCSVRVIVNVFNIGRTCLLPKYTFFISFCIKVIG